VRRSVATLVFGTVASTTLLARAVDAQPLEQQCSVDPRLERAARAALTDRSTVRSRDVVEQSGVAAPSVRLWVGRGARAASLTLAERWLFEQRLARATCLVSPLACDAAMCAVLVVPRVAALGLRAIQREGASFIEARVEPSVALPASALRGAQVVALSPSGHTFSTRLDQLIRAAEPGAWRVQLVLDAGDGPRPWAQRSVEVAPNVAAPSPSPAGNAPSSPVVIADARTWLIELNRRRVRAGFSALRAAPLLGALAEERARERSARQTVAHVVAPGDEPDARLAAQGIRAERVAENIVTAPTLEAAFERLEQSPSHRRVRYEPALDSVAIAITRGGSRVEGAERTGVVNEQWFVVELFATRPALAASR